MEEQMQDQGADQGQEGLEKEGQKLKGRVSPALTQLWEGLLII